MSKFYLICGTSSEMLPIFLASISVPPVLIFLPTALFYLLVFTTGSDLSSMRDANWLPARRQTNGQWPGSVEDKDCASNGMVGRPPSCQ